MIITAGVSRAVRGFQPRSFGSFCSRQAVTIAAFVCECLGIGAESPKAPSTAANMATVRSTPSSPGPPQTLAGSSPNISPPSSPAVNGHGDDGQGSNYSPAKPSSSTAGPKFKLLHEGDIQLCRLNHTRTIVSKIMNSKYLRRWESHHLELGDGEVRSLTVGSF